MTTRFKDFGSGGDSNKEPISFKLYEQEFLCHPALQGKVLLDMASASVSQDAAASAKIMYDFFKAAMQEESYTKFLAVLEDPNTIVTTRHRTPFNHLLTFTIDAAPQVDYGLI